MMRIPIVPTIFVAAAAGLMVWLGIWQIHRAAWKQDLIARYEHNSRLPPVAWPAAPPADDSLLYRHATGFCLRPVGWREIAGRNLKDEPGWSHIADCRVGAEGPGMAVDAGWSESPHPPQWRGGPVTGLIVPDRLHRIRLLADKAAPGLVASKPPAPRDMPQNHIFYAIQWFCFAAAALIIYLLALRKRLRDKVAPDRAAP
ncbi:MAG TPA: SURF1 family cytochrome oxidase biogenesis protein [Allosphingosinicella sp.]|jgi:cytochrome oxidase assembly protein ShyY1